MTCAEVLLLIRCELIRLQKKRKVDLDLVNMCLKNVEDNFFFYDYSQLTHVYNYVLKMKLQYFTPNLCTPAIVKKIRTYLQVFTFRNLVPIAENRRIHFDRSPDLLWTTPQRHWFRIGNPNQRIPPQNNQNQSFTHNHQITILLQIKLQLPMHRRRIIHFKPITHLPTYLRYSKRRNSQFH